MTRLWRAAPNSAPFFGRGSYWTPSPAFADRFAAWLTSTYGGPVDVFSVEVDVEPLLEVPFGTWVESPRVTALVDVLAADGYRWVSFYEGAFEGEVHHQFVYLGFEPLAAVMCGDACGRAVED